MDEKRTLRMLLDLADEIGIAVRPAPAGEGRDAHPGGALVRLKGEEILFLDRRASAADQLGAVAGALRGRRELDERFLPPEIREAIDTAEQA